MNGKRRVTLSRRHPRGVLRTLRSSEAVRRNALAFLVLAVEYWRLRAYQRAWGLEISL
jgi:hypothetical protein